MPNVTLKLVSPTGAPLELSIAPGDDTHEVIELLERADKAAAYLSGKGWSFADTEPKGPSAKELAAGPTFAGYPCSPTVNDAGIPTWILVNGQQAQRREKQGDVWFSAKVGEGQYETVLRIPKGEKPPQVIGLQ